MELLGLIAIAAFYLLPWIIGFNKRNSSAIFMLNLLLGWTVIGWIIALIWAFTTDSEPALVNVQTRQAEASPDRIEQVSRLKALLDSGAIDMIEYEREKKRILEA